MKTSIICTTIIACLALAACKDSQPEAGSIGSKIANGISGNIDKAQQELVTSKDDIEIGLRDGGKAILSHTGELHIGGKAVVLTDAQRELARQYYRNSRELALQGMEIGKQGVQLAGKVAGDAIFSAMSGKDEAQIEKDIEKKIESDVKAIETQAYALCDSAQKLQSVQDKLAAAVPAFTPKPIEVDYDAGSGDKGCRIVSADGNGELSYEAKTTAG